jgi:dolichol-phosphate mannosyltransferase
VKPRVSVVVTARDEGEQIVRCVERILEAVHLPCEVLVVYDTPDDSTAAWVEKCAAEDSRVKPVLNTVGAGPAGAIRAGFEAAAGGVVVVTMASSKEAWSSPAPPATATAAARSAAPG